MGRMSFLSPTICVKALKGTESTDLCLASSSSTTGLLVEGTLFPLRQLSDTSTSTLFPCMHKFQSFALALLLACLILCGTGLWTV